MIKTVLFDLDDTILDFNMSEKIAIIKTFESFGYDVTDEMILKYSQYNISQWKRLELGEISREEVKVNRFKLLFDDLGLDLSPKKTTSVYEENLAKGHYFVKGAEEMLNSIYKDYDLYLVSNGAKKVQEGRMSTANISHCFKDIFISEVVGYEKPNVEFFNYVFSKIKDFNRDETVIIGDSLTSDILGGKNAKIKTVWFNPNGKKCEDIVPDYQISNLSEVKPLLNSI